MDLDAALYRALSLALEEGSEACPPTLHKAMREAVLAGGARLRPQLCFATAGLTAGGDILKAAHKDARAVACALEFLHCASLVHDDLPCFDDASLRRGRPTIHARFGEAVAVLVGDALIMTAFAQVSRLSGPHASEVAHEVALAARRMVWGQALESEPETDLGQYHGHKTAALFEAAAVCGALVGPENKAERQNLAARTEAWRAFGGHVGALYQIADDILDVVTQTPVGPSSDKSGGRDDVLGRPNAVLRLGLGPARAALERRLCEAHRAIVPGPQHSGVSAWLGALEMRLGEATGLWRAKEVPQERAPRSPSPQVSSEAPMHAAP